MIYIYILLIMDDLQLIYDNLYTLFIDDDNSTLSHNEYLEFKSLFSDTIQTFFPELTHFIPQLDNILNIDIRYNLIGIKPIAYDFNQNFIRCEDRDAFYDSNYSIINREDLTTRQKRLFDQYKYLANLPQPVQKSKEWFDMRNNMITASNCGSVIGECKYTPIKALLIDKIGLGEKFRENKFVYHGKKYEKIAIMIYENIYNSKVGEFGLIQHPTISYLGASPDGICMSLTLDGKINKLIGRMLEIKCPPARKIQSNGKIKGDICPDYYWIQVQIQLECCDLDECDFWQCHLIEYESEKDFINDPVDDLVHSQSEQYIQDIDTEIDEPAIKIMIDKRNRKGALIELLPIDQSKIPKGDLVEWYGKYIYPPTILLNESEYKNWINNTIQNLSTLYPELIIEYKFSRIVYWKLQSSHNELIVRQKEWFEKNKEFYRIFWNRVKYYREHLEHAKYDLIDRRLSNDIFLKSTTDRITVKEPTTKKDSIFIKSNKQSNVEFLTSSEEKPKIIKKQSKDEFLTSSEEKPKIIKKQSNAKVIYSPVDQPIIKSIPKSKKLEYINQIQKIDVSSESEKIPNTPLYKNNQPNTINDLELVIIGENRKKKHNKKK